MNTPEKAATPLHFLRSFNPQLAWRTTRDAARLFCAAAGVGAMCAIATFGAWFLAGMTVAVALFWLALYKIEEVYALRKEPLPSNQKEFWNAH